MIKEGDISHETDFSGKIRFLTLNDFARVHHLLKEWVRDSQTGQVETVEVDGILGELVESLQKDDEKVFLVAEKDGKVVGLMGLRPPEEKIQPYVSTQKPIELVNAFTSPEIQGKGEHVGSALVSGLTNLAKELGCTEIILSSGPRYEKSGWPAWRKLFGPEIATAPNYFAPGVFAKIWSKTI